MSDARRNRIETDAAIALLFVGGMSLGCMAAVAQGQMTAIDPYAVKTIAGMSPTELLALIALIALGLCGYLIRLLFTRLLTVLDDNATANKEMARLLAERPCIRRPENN